MSQELLSLGQASQWASDYLDRPVTTSNISYLIQYAKIRKYLDEEKKIKVNLDELKKYADLAINKANNLGIQLRIILPSIKISENN